MPELVIDGVNVHIEGEGPETIVMLHGWPDTYRLWDATVDALAPQRRCVRFTVPGFDPALPPRALSLTQMNDFLRRLIDTVSPDRPVTLLLHDWGCVFGFAFLNLHAARVARVIAMDVGDYNSGALVRSLPATARLAVLAYQLWLAIAWRLRGPLGTWMTRRMARALRAPAPATHIDWCMNYPYAMRWFGVAGGLGGAGPVNPECPTLFLYGQRKPFMFHSERWVTKLRERRGSAVHAIDAGHWVMVDQPAAVQAHISAWLNATPAIA